MNFKVMARTIAVALSEKDTDIVDFNWHGGEPTLMPISYYEKALYVQSCFRRPGQIITNNIQTNGTRISNAWAEFLKASEFIVGISIDGPPDIHNRYRRYASGAPSFDDILNTIEIFRQYDIPFSVLMVIDEAAMELGPKKIFDFFVSAKINNYGLLAATPLNGQKPSELGSFNHYINPSRFTDFLIKLYDCWREYGDPNIRIREIDSILNRLKGNSKYCTTAGGCFGHYYIIEPNGDVGHCDLFSGDEAYTLGNILHKSFSDFRKGDRLISLKNANESELVPMQSCPEFRVCNGWCPHERYLSVRHNPHHRSDCCGLRDLIAHIRSNLPN